MLAATGGLLLAFGVDLMLGAHMVVGMGHILQMMWDVTPQCWEECHMLGLLLLWASATIIGVLVQASDLLIFLFFFSTCSQCILLSVAMMRGEKRTYT